MSFGKTVSTGVVVLAAGIISGCALVPGLRVSAGDSQPQGAVPYDVVNITPELIAQQKLAAADGMVEPNGLPAADPAAPPSDYVIGPGDVLQIVVWDHVELTNPFGAVTRDPVTAGQLVAADGTVFFPYAGIVLVGGKTVKQVRAELTSKLGSVVTRPQVDVRVVAYRSGRIQVTGEVATPGLVTLDDTTKGVLEAINERGGLSPTASRRTAVLVREGKSYEVDMAGLLSGERPSVNPALKPGDIVHVPDASNDQVYVLGEVERQGSIPMGQQRMSLTEALTKAEGLAKTTANDSGVLVFRLPEKAGGAAQIYTLDLSMPSGILLAGEFNLQSRDVVYVKATRFSQYNLVINQFLPTITTIYQVDRLTE